MNSVRKLPRLGLASTVCLYGVVFGASSSGEHQLPSHFVAAPASTDQEKPKPAEDQTGRRAGESFLNLTVRLHEDGTSEIIRAKQVDGKLIERRGPATDYVYEIVKDGKPFAVGFLPEGTFSFRGFKPEDGGREKTGTTSSATLNLNVPDTGLDSAKQGKIALRIYKVQLNIQVDILSPEALKKLITTKKASLQFELSGTTIAAQTKELHRLPAEAPK
jgi:hypothetical protein